jgi:hypothetical protein
MTNRSRGEFFIPRSPNLVPHSRLLTGNPAPSGTIGNGHSGMTKASGISAFCHEFRRYRRKGLALWGRLPLPLRKAVGNFLFHRRAVVSPLFPDRMRVVRAKWGIPKGMKMELNLRWERHRKEEEYGHYLAVPGKLRKEMCV